MKIESALGLRADPCRLTHALTHALTQALTHGLTIRDNAVLLFVMLVHVQFHDGLGFLTNHAMISNTFEYSLQVWITAVLSLLLVSFCCCSVQR